LDAVDRRWIGARRDPEQVLKTLTVEAPRDGLMEREQDSDTPKGAIERRHVFAELAGALGDRVLRVEGREDVAHPLLDEEDGGREDLDVVRDGLSKVLDRAARAELGTLARVALLRHGSEISPALGRRGAELRLNPCTRGKRAPQLRFGGGDVVSRLLLARGCGER